MTKNKPTTGQIKYIRGLVGHNQEAKEAAVLGITKGRSCHITEMSFSEASELIKSLKNRKETKITPRYLQFDLSNTKHRYILSLCKQLGWSKPSSKHGTVANMVTLNNWLMSEKSPVKNCLMDIPYIQLSKVIHALEQILIK